MMNDTRPDKVKGDILIVDDNLNNLQLLSSTLGIQGYEVRGAQNGKTALSFIEKDPPELILLDIRMADMDGYEVCKRLKADERHRHIPIIFLSALKEIYDKVEGFEAGAVDFITKPFQAEEVLARVDTHLTLSRLRRNLEQQVEKRTAELKESEERYRSIVETSPVSIMAIRDGCFLFVNPAGARMLGFSAPEGMIGISATKVVAPESQQLVMKRLKRLEKEKDNPTVEIELIRQDGTRITVESTSVSVPIGGIPTAVIITQDISVRKKTEMNLRESEERFRAFMDNNPAVAYMKNESLQHVYGNRTLFDAFETSPDKFIGTTTKDIFPADIARRIEAYDSEVLSGRVVVEVEPFCEETQGQRRWWKEVKFPFTDYSGKTMIGGLSFNITALKQSEEKLKKAYNEIKELKDRIEQENIYLREEIKLEHQHESFIGKSNAVKHVLHQAEEVGKTESTVLILGETGTGKGLLAREIHKMSARKDRPIVNVNCVSLPPTLVEAELFGREKGAYTGALSKQAGRFEIADGATIFLDEIGELPLEIQVKLLRVLHESQFERLGSHKTITVDVRIIAATNRDLEKAVEEGKFREDLYYRLNVYPIKIPPLRDRLEDIAPLVWAFVREFGDKMGKKIDRISRNNIEALKRYNWPGNVRELRNVVERAMIVSMGSTLKIDTLKVKPAKSSRIESLDELQRKQIVQALEMTGWRVSGKHGAAAMLQINPKTLESKMRKLGINRKRQAS